MNDYLEPALVNVLAFTCAAAVVIVVGFLGWGFVALGRAVVRSLGQLRVRRVRP